MNTIKINKGSTKIIAHRGLSGIECENTNAAFVAAGNRSYYGIETDVHVTSDGKFIIIHDDVTGRVSNVDVSVEESTFDNLKAIALKNPRFDEKRTDINMPELVEYIGICRKYEKIAVLEFKNRIPTEEIKEIVKIIESEDYLDNMVFISFNWDNMLDIRSILPKCKAQFLVNECDDKLIEKLKENNLDLDIRHTSVTAELVEKLHKNGIEINCWTCDTAEDAEKLMSYGVDYITTNILE